MFADSALSSCLLLLASGSCIYLVGKRSTDNFSKFPPEIIAASIGTLAINFRSLFNLLSPFFFHNSYSIDPLEIDDETKEKAEARLAPFHEKLCRVFSMAGLIYAVCEAHGNRKTGIFIVSSLAFAECYHALQDSYPSQTKDELFHFMWMMPGGSFGWFKRNYYCLFAFLPYGISFFVFTPEKDCAWSVRRLINNYMMMVYIFLMLEAIREAKSIDS